MIEIEGQKYRVTGNIGYVSSAGFYAKEVDTPDGLRVAIRYPGRKKWGWWMPKDKLQIGGHGGGQGLPVDPGIPHEGCDYLAPTGGWCYKCGFSQR